MFSNVKSTDCHQTYRFKTCLLSGRLIRVWNTRSTYSYSRVSNWILTSCQHRVTSRQSNTAQKQTHISKLFSSIYKNALPSQSKKTNHFANVKHTQKLQTHIFQQLMFCTLPLLKEHVRLGHAGIVDHSNC